MNAKEEMQKKKNPENVENYVKKEDAFLLLKKMRNLI